MDENLNLNPPQPSVADMPPPPPQVADQPPAPPIVPKNNKNVIIGGFFLLLTFISLGVAIYFAYQNQKLKNELSQALKAQETPSPTQTPDVTADWERSSIKNLTFKIPNTWWVSKALSDEEESWIMINPTSLEKDPEPFPIFTIYYQTNTTLEKIKQNLIKAIPLSNINEENLTIPAGQGMLLLSAEVPLGPLQGNIVYAFLTSGKDIYYMVDIGGIENHTEVFNQILSTFEFTDNDNQVSEKQVLIEYLKNEFAQDQSTPTKPEEIVINVQKFEDNYAMGTSGFTKYNGGGGGVWFATKQSRQWIVVEKTQEPPSCSIMKKYNFPESIYETCNL